jgi:hypothetical protein
MLDGDSKKLSFDFKKPKKTPSPSKSSSMSMLEISTSRLSFDSKKNIKKKKEK